MVKIDAVINTTDVDPGTYNGKIIISYVNASSIEIPYKIQIRGPILWAFIVNCIGVSIGFVGTLLGIQIDTSEIIKTENSQTEKKGIINRIRQGLNTIRLSYQIQTSPQNLNKTIAVWATRLILLAIAIVLSFVAFYPQIYDFGAQLYLDYATAFTFGLAQWGISDFGGKIARKA